MTMPAYDSGKYANGFFKGKIVWIQTFDIRSCRLINM